MKAVFKVVFFSSELTQHLNDGGHVLVFYYLNNV